MDFDGPGAGCRDVGFRDRDPLDGERFSDVLVDQRLEAHFGVDRTANIEEHGARQA